MNFEVMARLSLGRYYRESDRSPAGPSMPRRSSSTSPTPTATPPTTTPTRTSRSSATARSRTATGPCRPQITGTKDNKPGQEVAKVDYRLRAKDGPVEGHRPDHRRREPGREFPLAVPGNHGQRRHRQAAPTPARKKCRQRQVTPTSASHRGSAPVDRPTPPRRTAAPRRRCWPSLAFCLCGGCASGPNKADPWEKTNRFIYNVNDGIDRVALKPAADAYMKVVPKPIRTGIGNGFDNLIYFNVILNDFLQGKWDQGLGDAGRMAANSTVGIARHLRRGDRLGPARPPERLRHHPGQMGRGAGAVPRAAAVRAFHAARRAGAAGRVRRHADDLPGCCRAAVTLPAGGRRPRRRALARRHAVPLPQRHRPGPLRLHPRRLPAIPRRPHPRRQARRPRPEHLRHGPGFRPDDGPRRDASAVRARRRPVTRRSAGAAFATTASRRGGPVRRDASAVARPSRALPPFLRHSLGL